MIQILHNLKQTKALPVLLLLSLLPSPDTHRPQVRLSLCSTLDCWDYGERSASSLPTTPAWMGETTEAIWVERGGQSCIKCSQRFSVDNTEGVGQVVF